VATTGIDSGGAALVLAAMNGGTALSVATPMRLLFLSAVRTADNGTDTEIATSAGYVQGAGSLYGGVGLAFAAATQDATGAHQASNVAASVVNMPASTWAGNVITDSKATPRTTGATGNTTSGSPTVTASDGAFLSSDVGAIISGTNIPSNSIIVTVNSGTSVTISQNATGTATTTALTINRLNSPVKTFWMTLASSKTVNAGDTVTVPSGSLTTNLG
jgi:hypothetical protein